MPRRKTSVRKSLYTLRRIASYRENNTCPKRTESVLILLQRADSPLGTMSGCKQAKADCAASAFACCLLPPTPVNEWLTTSSRVTKYWRVLLNDACGYTSFSIVRKSFPSASAFFVRVAGDWSLFHFLLRWAYSNAITQWYIDCCNDCVLVRHNRYSQCRYLSQVGR